MITATAARLNTNKYDVMKESLSLVDSCIVSSSLNGKHKTQFCIDRLTSEQRSRFIDILRNQYGFEVRPNRINITISW